MALNIFENSETIDYIKIQKIILESSLKARTIILNHTNCLETTESQQCFSEYKMRVLQKIITLHLTDVSFF